MKLPYPIHPASRPPRGVRLFDIAAAVATSAAAFTLAALLCWIVCNLKPLL